MRNRTKLIFTGLTAALLMSLAVSVASANSLSTSEPKFKAVWGQLRFVEEGGGTLVECPVTLEGSFHSSTIAKVPGSLIGHVSRAVKGACGTEQATILTATLPWHVTYQGIRGTLPNPEGIRVLLLGASFRLRIFGFIFCLSVTTAESPSNGIIEGITYREGNGTVSTLSPEPSDSIPCGGFSGRFASAANVYRLGTTNQDVLIRLI